MSAIWGLVAFDSTTNTRDLSKMELPYRERCKIERYSGNTMKNASFFCGLQFITKESEQEILPICDDINGILFTADCLLDNRSELISELSASSQEPDGTLMYLAYRKWGIDCVRHFRGLFSLAIYDRQHSVLYLAADQLSSRCLYYYRDGQSIFFSTLIDSIRLECSEIAPNINYIKDYLTAPGLMPNIVANETPYQGLYKLNPGTYLTITATDFKETSYWTPSENRNILKNCKKPEDYRNAFFDLYTDCVKDALRSTGGIGIAMSSGMDSASVGALAAKELQKTGQTLMTYTYVPHLKPTLHVSKTNIMDETKDVEMIQSMYPNMVPHFLDNEGKNCIESLSDSLNIMEFPFKAYTNLPNLREIYHQASADNCKVLLTGQCGNSTVSHGYIDDVLYDLYSTGHYFKFLFYLNHYSKTVKESRKQALKGCIGYFNYAKQQYSNPRFDYSPEGCFLSEYILENYPMEQRYVDSGNGLLVKIPTSSAYYHASLYKPAIYAYMGELETKMGLYYGIVIRDATKDKRMMEFCYHLPYKYFALDGVPRWLIRSSFKHLLPEAHLNNWMRYGVQNGDFLGRIERDLNSLLPMFQSVFANEATNSTLENCLDYSRIQEYLKSLSSETSLQLQDFDDFIYAYVLQLFWRQRQLPPL